MSVTSALVGLGLCFIDSNISVATIAIFLCFLHILTIFFWQTGNSSNGISTPKSPRATIIPSLTLMISSKLSIPICDSILEIIFMSSRFCSFNISLIASTSSALCTNDAAR